VNRAADRPAATLGRTRTSSRERVLPAPDRQLAPTGHRDLSRRADSIRDRRSHGCRRGPQPRLDQLPELLGPAKRVAAFFVRADGITTGRLRRNVPGVLISAVDTRQDLYDSTAA
jgi:hypothetical protein